MTDKTYTWDEITDMPCGTVVQRAGVPIDRFAVGHEGVVFIVGLNEALIASPGIWRDCKFVVLPETAKIKHRIEITTKYAPLSACKSGWYKDKNGILIAKLLDGRAVFKHTVGLIPANPYAPVIPFEETPAFGYQDLNRTPCGLWFLGADGRYYANLGGQRVKVQSDELHLVDSFPDIIYTLVDKKITVKLEDVR